MGMFPWKGKRNLWQRSGEIRASLDWAESYNFLILLKWTSSTLRLSVTRSVIFSQPPVLGKCFIQSLALLWDEKKKALFFLFIAFTEKTPRAGEEPRESGPQGAMDTQQTAGIHWAVFAPATRGCIHQSPLGPILELIWFSLGLFSLKNPAWAQ